MRYETNPKGRNHGVDSTRKKEWNDWNKCANRGGDTSRKRSGPLIWKAMLGQAEFALGHSLHELLRLLRKAFRHFLRFFGSESLQLIKERHLLNFFLRIFFDLGALARNFRFIDFRLAFCGKIRACAH